MKILCDASPGTIRSNQPGEGRTPAQKGKICREVSRASARVVPAPIVADNDVKGS